jgi:hypothetical protein
MHKSLVNLDGFAQIALLESVSKNLALDAIADLARGELGESASDFSVIAWIEQRIAPVAAARNDRPPRIMARFNRSIEAAGRYEKSAADAGRLKLVGAKQV